MFWKITFIHENWVKRKLSFTLKWRNQINIKYKTTSVFEFTCLHIYSNYKTNLRNNSLNSHASINKLASVTFPVNTLSLNLWFLWMSFTSSKYLVDFGLTDTMMVPQEALNVQWLTVLAKDEATAVLHPGTSESVTEEIIIFRKVSSTSIKMAQFPDTRRHNVHTFS